MAQLSNCIIVSARVLGLRKILRRKPNSLAPQAMAGLRELLGTLKTPETAIQIEDRIVLVCPVVDDEGVGILAEKILAELLAELAFLQIKLADQGFFLSGAVVWGQVLVERIQGQHDLSGPGIRRAHRLARQNRAPCLQIDPNTAASLFSLHPHAPHAAWQHIQDDVWGRYLWDYLSFSARIEEGTRGVFAGVLGIHKRALEEAVRGLSKATEIALPDWLAWLVCYHVHVVRRAMKLQSGELGELAPLEAIDGLVAYPLLAQGGFQPADLRLIRC